MTDAQITYHGLQIGIIQMQISSMNNFGYDRTRIEQDLPFTYEGQFCTQLTAPYLL